jgi:hypothetical protein
MLTVESGGIPFHSPKGLARSNSQLLANEWQKMTKNKKSRFPSAQNSITQ